MRRVITALAFLLVIGGLWMAYHDVRELIAQPTPRPSETGDGLTNPPNWKVELPTPPTARDAAARNRFGNAAGAPIAIPMKYGVVDPSAPPLWVRKTGKVSLPAPVARQRVGSVQPPNGPVPLAEPEEVPPPPPAPVVQAAASPSLVAVQAQPRNSTEAGIDEEHRALLNHARFLIRAGLAPMAKDPLQQIIREVPSSPLAREARLTLETIRN